MNVKNKILFNGLNILIILITIPLIYGKTPDFNGNGIVGFEDFFMFADNFNSGVNSQTEKFDLDDNKNIDIDDFFLFVDCFNINSNKYSGKCLFACEDKTLINQCSNSKEYGLPYACNYDKYNELNLMEDCFDCGCPENTKCSADGFCEEQETGITITVSTEKDKYYTGEAIKLSSELRAILPKNTIDVVKSIPSFYKKYQDKIVRSLGGLYVEKPIVRSDFDGYIVVLKDPSGSEEFERLSKIRAKRIGGSVDVGKQMKKYVDGLKETQNDLLQDFNAGNLITGNVPAIDSSIVLKARYYSVLNGLWIDGSREAIEKIRKDGRVKSITPSYMYYPLLYRSVSAINAGNLNYKSVDKILTGKGVKVAVIDTGIDYTHKDFGNCNEQQIRINSCSKIIDSFNFVSNNKNAFDDNGHGTHVASTIAGNGDLKGVAPDASLMIYKVCNGGGECPEGAILGGLERAIDPNQDFMYDDKADIISMSLGGSASNPPEEDTFHLPINNAVDVGSIVVIAAGNDGPDKNTISSPGSMQNAITVGASCLTEQVWEHEYCSSEYPYIALFSSRGPSFINDKPDVVALGVDICAAKSSGASSDFGKPCYNSNYVMISGTSMATPHVSGAVALIKEAHPDWDSEMVKNALKNTAKSFGYPRYVQGSGLIDVKKALDFDRVIDLKIEKISGGEYGQVEG